MYYSCFYPSSQISDIRKNITRKKRPVICITSFETKSYYYFVSILPALSFLWNFCIFSWNRNKKREKVFFTRYSQIFQTVKEQTSACSICNEKRLFMSFCCCQKSARSNNTC